MMKKILLPLLLLFFSTTMIATPVDYEPNSDLVRIEFSVYPNPTNGVFYLSIEDYSDETYQVRIVDLIGKEIESRKVSANQEEIFDLSTAPKGIYFVKITQGRDQIIKRLVIQ